MAWRLCRHDGGVVALGPPSALGDAWWLCHTETQERKKLPPPRNGAEWLLGFDADGKAFLDDTADSGPEESGGQWAQDLFSMNLYENDAGDRIVLHARSNTIIKWEDYVAGQLFGASQLQDRRGEGEGARCSCRCVPHAPGCASVVGHRRLAQAPRYGLQRLSVAVGVMLVASMEALRDLRVAVERDPHEVVKPPWA